MNLSARTLSIALLATLFLSLAIDGGQAVSSSRAVADQQSRTNAIVDRVSAAWFRSEWSSYAARFVSPEGRVIDNANGGVSHSEGQGYGLLLAAQADDAERFETLWRWTARNLLVRKDGLAAWQWDPKVGAVTDMNDAADGDILLAWALSEGARRFGRADYHEASERIARAVGAEAVRSGRSGPILMPGATGFDDGEQPDGPVVNLSYWIFPAFPALKAVAPDTDWDGLARHGLALLDASRFGAFGLPTEWESLAGPLPRPARNFRTEFGYNAIRIPLYLALDGGPASRKALRRFASAFAQPVSRPLDIKLAATPPLGSAGYDLVVALARCAAAGQVIPADVIKARSDLYYPETLRLMSIIAIQERFPQCL